jgi:ABC-type phosphate/phosphonate transport system substrate-binding protein
MKKLLSMTLVIAALAMVAGCGPKEAETPSDALEPKKMTMPGAVPADPKNIDPSMKEDMRKQMGR